MIELRVTLAVLLVARASAQAATPQRDYFAVVRPYADAMIEPGRIAAEKSILH